jgi:ankyrin repeat protein
LRSTPSAALHLGLDALQSHHLLVLLVLFVLLVLLLLLVHPLVVPACCGRPDAEGVSPLMWASWKGHDEIVRLLLDGKADVHAPSNTGRRQARVSFAKSACIGAFDLRT